MDVLEAIKKRQSIREYAERKVPHDLLRELISYAQWAPTSCNLQLTEYIVVDDDRVLAELAKNATRKFLWGSTFIVFIYDPRFTVKRGATLTSLGASIQNILLAATHYGLSACPMAGFGKDAAIKRILKIPGVYEIGLIMSIGYAKNPSVKTRDRLGEDRVLHWNEYTDRGNLLNDSTNLDRWSFDDLVNYRSRMAPVYLYNNVFNLSIFSKRTFGEAYQRLEAYLKSGMRILDLVSYDGTFVKTLFEARPDMRITASDIIPYTLRVLKENFPGIETAILRNNYTVPFGNEAFDAVTFVHKAEFMPDIETIAREAYRLLKPGGIFFITSTDEKPLKQILRTLHDAKRKYIDREVMNVYENSPYYRIGPMKARNGAFLERTARAAGFSMLDGGLVTVPESGTVPHRFLWRVFRK
ncbi:MAG: nitroreductase family protein [Patescibacteria group bacterium]